MAKFFTNEEVQDILLEIERASRVQGEARRRQESVDQIGKDDSPSLGKVLQIVEVAVKSKVGGFILSLFPREISAAISGASLFGGLVPIGGAALGAVVGPLIEQARRKQERVDLKIRAQIRAEGVAADINKTFVPPENFDAVIQEGSALLVQAEDAVKSGNIDEITRSIKRITTTGRASVAAAKAYSDTLADWQGTTRAKQAAFQAYYRAQGPYIPRPLFEEQRAINNRADKQFKNFHKDPPIKG